MKPGFYYGMPEAEYHDMKADVPILSSSICKLLCNETPLHAWTAHNQLNPDFEREEKNHFDIGNVCHALLLEGITKAEIMDFDDRRTKEYKLKAEAARLAGKIPILRKDWKDISAMVGSATKQIQKNRQAKDAFTNGKPEVTIVWEEEGGVLCKARIDWLHDDFKMIDDYKTAANANPDTLARKLDDDGLDIQEAFYRRGIEVLMKVNPEFRFVFQEKAAPYAVCVVGLDNVWQTIGEKKRLFALETWRKCLATNDWPGYPTAICCPTMTTWMEDRWLRKETGDAI